MYIVCLLFVTVAIYLNTLHNQFVFDDIPLILDNPPVKYLDNISHFTSGIGKIPYRPLRGMSYALDYRFTGLNPVGYHISNIVFHVLTTLLVYFITAALTGNMRVAFFASCLFAVHPVHTESVAYISGRRDILSTLFYLLGFYLFLLARQRHKKKFILPALVAYLLALASKEMAVTLPAVFFVYDLFFNLPEQGSLGKRCAASLKRVFSSYKLFYLSLSTIGILFTCYTVVIKSSSNKVGFYGGSLYVQVLTVCKMLVYYIKILFYPVNLIADYSFNAFPLSQSFFEPATLFSLMTLCALAFLTGKLLVRNTLMAFALVWFFITLLPVCHIIPHHELLAEHYLYLPSFGFVVLMALLLERALTFIRWRSSVYIAFAVIIVLFSARTVYRNYDWKNGYTLWTRTVKMVPNCVRALNNLGIECYKRRDLIKAKKLYRRALTIQPNYVKSYHNLGNVYSVEKDFTRAVEMYKKAIQLDPKNVRYHINIGNVYAVQKNYDEALRAYQLALYYKPLNAEAHNNLGKIYTRTNRYREAIEHYTKALEIQPAFLEPHLSLARLYLQKYQDNRKALYHLKRWLKKAPGDPRADSVRKQADKIEKALYAD